MRSIALLAFPMLSLAVAAPAFTRDAMAQHDQMASHDQMSSGAMKMSVTHMRKAKACKAMSHDAMMKNAGCATLMTAHPDMMKHDDMMSAGH